MRLPLWPVAAACIVGVKAARAQTAPAPATGAPRQVFNEVFLGQPAAPSFVVLSEGLVYRIEIEPATAQVSVRVARRASLPPPLLVPLSDASGSAGGAAYLMVPRSSDEYRLDVTSLGDEPVRVRIATDSAENARWERIREASRDQPPAGISARAVHFGAFRSRARYQGDSSLAESGSGVEACFALLPHGAWLRQAYGGCVLSVTIVRRGAMAGDAMFISTAPRIELMGRGSATRLALALQVGVGQTTSGTGTQIDFFLFGASVLAGIPVPGTRRHLVAEGELGVSSIQGSVSSSDARTHFVPKLGAGLQVAF